MAGDTTICVIGNLTADPELRFTPAGAAVANFTIASTPRKFNRQTNEWTDGETLFLRCSIWREAAENVVESLQKGMAVIAQGRLTMRSYQTQEGEKRTSTELEVDEIGPSLRRATAKVQKALRQGQPQGGQGQQQGQGWGGQQQGGQQGGGQQGGGQQGGGQQGGGWGQQQGGPRGAQRSNGPAPADDPWATQPGNGGWGTQPAADDEPPF